MGATTNRTMAGPSSSPPASWSVKRRPAPGLDEKTAMAGRLQRLATAEARAVRSKEKAKVWQGRRTWRGRRLDAAGHLQSPAAWRRSSLEDVLGPI